MAGKAGEGGGAGTVTGGAARLSEASMERPLLGVGIAGVRRRLQQLGGRLEITSTTLGTTIMAIAPLNEKLWHDPMSDDGQTNDALGSPQDSAPL